MSNTPPTPTSAAEPLVTVLEIIDIVGILAKKRPLISYDLFGEFQREMLKICDKYERERASAHARINELEAENRELSRMVSLEFEQAMKKGQPASASSEGTVQDGTS